MNEPSHFGEDEHGRAFTVIATNPPPNWMVGVAAWKSVGGEIKTTLVYPICVRTVHYYEIEYDGEDMPCYSEMITFLHDGLVITEEDAWMNNINVVCWGRTEEAESLKERAIRVIECRNHISIDASET